jgi:hypothetical protein
MLPSFVIIGAQKAGSTLLLRCLAEHPGIYMPQHEVRFFQDPEYRRGNIRDLSALFEHEDQSKVFGIKRPDYLALPEVPARIHEHMPEARLIAILRNPVDRAVSAYFHFMNYGFIPVRSPEEGLDRIMRGHHDPRYPKSREILEYGFYYRHLMRYAALFRRERLRVVLYDALKADPGEIVRGTYAFLGVDESFIPEVLRSRDGRMVNEGVYSLPRLRWLGLRNGLVYRFETPRTRSHRRAAPGLSARMLTRLITSVDEFVLEPVLGNSKPVLDPTLRHRLYRIYAEDIDRLEQWLQTDLAAWKVR